MTKHNLNELDLELEAINKVIALGYYKKIDANSETFGDNGTLGRKTSEEVILVNKLHHALVKLNPDLPNEAIDNALYSLCEGKTNLSLDKANQYFYNLIKEGVKVTFKDSDGIEVQETVNVIDWNIPTENDFLIARQFKISGDMYNCRADLIIFVNGLPLVLIELKASHKSLVNGFTDNITHYKHAIPQLFWYNALIVVSNGTDTRIGSVTADWEHYAQWKKINSEGEQGIISLDTVVKGVFEPERLLDIIENFILFIEVEGGVAKIIAKNHQYLGVNNTIEAVKNRKALDGRLGIFWHTQGSGKSLSMVFLTQKILRKLVGNWTFLIVTDRDDLDQQIYGVFVNAGAVTEKDVHAKNRKHLKELLSEDHRTVFTMIQKFSTENKGDPFEEITDRDDIIVMNDEAHRSQYNILAMNMRKALPNASFLAFTGTPLISGSDDEGKTKEVFGEYVSIYNFRESIDDNATVKLYYENRIPDLQIANKNLDEDIHAIIEQADLTDQQEEDFSKKYVNLYQLITRDDRLETIAEDVVKHFMKRGFMGKAMYIAIDKAVAIKMYDKVKKYWQCYIEKLEEYLKTCADSHKQSIQDKLKYMRETDMAVVVSKAQNEIETLKKKGADITSHRQRMNKEGLAERFKQPKDPLRIVFVCAMWVTGFDAKSVSTLYLDKILKDHTLMQTMARANRVWKDKPNGIVVDYIGLFQSLQKALAIYGKASLSPGSDGQKNSQPIQDKHELVKLLADASLEINHFLNEKNICLEDIIVQQDNFNKIHLVDVAVEQILSSYKSKETFLNLANRLDRLIKAVLPDVRAEKYLKKMLVLSVLVAKVHEADALISDVDKFRERRKIEALAEQVSALLNESITVDDYKIKDSNPFDITQVDFDELKQRFLKADSQKTILEKFHTAVQRKIKESMAFNRCNESYLKKFEELISHYNSGDIDADKFFLELVSLSRSLNEEEDRHVRENLTQEELVIFDILTKPKPKLSKSDREIVKRVAKKLLAKLKKERLVIDWRKKQATRAKVLNTIHELCEELPEKPYNVELYKDKCDSIYEHIYDNYGSGEYIISQGQKKELDFSMSL